MNRIPYFLMAGRAKENLAGDSLKYPYILKSLYLNVVILYIYIYIYIYIYTSNIYIYI